MNTEEFSFPIITTKNQEFLSMNTEEFSFPIITTNNIGHLTTTILPPLWRISSVNSAADLDGGRRRKTKILTSSVSRGEMSETCVCDSAEAEEKMDVLWEDFNEELEIRSSINSESDHNNNCGEEFESGEEFNDDDGVGEMEMRYGSLIPTKKKNLELIVKMFKKVFLLENMAAIKKRGHN